MTEIISIIVSLGVAILIINIIMRVFRYILGK